MKELEAEMDNVRLNPHSQVGYTHPTYRPQRYAAEMFQYSSFPHLERIPTSPARMMQHPPASHILTTTVEPLSQDQDKAAASTKDAEHSAVQTEAVDQPSSAVQADDLAQASKTESAKSAPVSQMDSVDSIASVSSAIPTSSLVPPAVSAVPVLPIQTAPPSSQPAYS
ncbi:Embigin, partial [Nibea albiflora]